MRPIDRIRALHKLVQATRKTVVVDVGANPFNGTPVYAQLRKSGVAHIIGFEPQPEALAPAIHWSYLAAGNTWLPFKTGEIIRDNTNGLTRSGIIQFAIPTLAVKENTMLNPEYFWLRAAAKQADPALNESLTTVQALPSMTKPGSSATRTGRPVPWPWPEGVCSP